MRATRKPRMVLLGVACVTALAACGSSSPSSSSSGPAKSVKTVLICEVSDFSGTQGVLTTTEAGGGATAAAIVNAAGGIKSLGGAKIVIQKFDTQSNPDMGSTEATKAASAGCKAIFGGQITDTIMSATLVSHRAGIPWVDIGGIGDAVHQRGFNNVFQLITTTGLAQNYQTIMKFVASQLHLSSPTVGLSVSDTTYGQDFYTAWSKVNSGGPFKVVSNGTYPLGTTDLSPIAARMVSKSPDILFNMGYPPDGVALGKLFKQTFHTTAKAFFSTAEAAVAVPQIGSFANGQIFGATNPPGSSPDLTAFNTEYLKLTKQQPSIECWQGYTAMMFIAAALQKAASTNPSAIAAALHQVTLNSSNGDIYPSPLAFGSDGVMTYQPYYWQQDQAGKLLFIYPTSLKQASVIPYSG